MKQQIILFDGYCNLCNSAVNFIIRHDNKKIFLFSGLDSKPAGEILSERSYCLNNNKSILLVDDTHIYSRSTAALRIARHLDGGLSLLYVFIVIPSFIRDWVYNFIAGNRYKWFGRKDQCMVPTTELKARFLE